MGARTCTGRARTVCAFVACGAYLPAACAAGWLCRCKRRAATCPATSAVGTVLTKLGTPGACVAPADERPASSAWRGKTVHHPTICGPSAARPSHASRRKGGNVRRVTSAAGCACCAFLYFFYLQEVSLLWHRWSCAGRRRRQHVKKAKDVTALCAPENL